MKNFVIFFNGHEGSTAIISHLKKLENMVDIIWYEPFDNCHLKKRLGGRDLKNIFKAVFSNHTQGYTVASKIYKSYSDKPLTKFSANKSVGFKMRCRAFNDIHPILKEKKVVVFVLIRRNIARWALSRCRPNSLQFKLVRKEIDQNPKLDVDLKLFEQKVELCQRLLKEKKDLLNTCRKLGIEAHPIYYEDYCEDKVGFFTNIFGKLGIRMDKKHIESFANRDVYFKKVHDDDISKFVTNYQEVLDFIKKRGLKL